MFLPNATLIEWDWRKYGAKENWKCKTKLKIWPKQILKYHNKYPWRMYSKNWKYRTWKKWEIELKKSYIRGDWILLTHFSHSPYIRKFYYPVAPIFASHKIIVCASRIFNKIFRRDFDEFDQTYSNTWMRYIISAWIRI